MSIALARGIRIGLIVLLWMPLIVTDNQTIFPHAVGKAIFARSLIEMLAAAWIMLIVAGSGVPPFVSRSSGLTSIPLARTR